MPNLLLNEPAIGTILSQVGDIGMAKRMRRERAGQPERRAAKSMARKSRRRRAGGSPRT
jgi:hypothetical protein